MTKPPVAGSRAPRCRLRQPALAAAVAPFGGEHDEVERVRRLDLEPARAAAAGLVRRVERLRHHALVAARERVVVEAPRPAPTSAVTMRGIDEPAPAARRAARRSARAPGWSSSVSPSRCRQSKKNAAQRQLGAQPLDVELAAEAAHRDLERHAARRRRASAIASPSRISSRAGSARTASTTSGTARGDVVERARVDAHVVARLVHLHARAVELPFERRRSPSSRQRVGDVVGRSARASAAAAGSSCEPKRAQPGARLRASAARATAPRSPATIAARRSSASGNRRGRATASTITPSSAPWRSSPRRRGSGNPAPGRWRATGVRPQAAPVRRPSRSP